MLFLKETLKSRDWTTEQKFWLYYNYGILNLELLATYSAVMLIVFYESDTSTALDIIQCLVAGILVCIAGTFGFLMLPTIGIALGELIRFGGVIGFLMCESGSGQLHSYAYVWLLFSAFNWIGVWRMRSHKWYFV